jgi:hypothetical protein
MLQQLHEIVDFNASYYATAAVATATVAGPYSVELLPAAALTTVLTHVAHLQPKRSSICKW